MVDVVKIWDGPAQLGESPLWDHRDRTLYWLDIERSRLYARPEAVGVTQEIILPAMAGSLALCAQGGLLAAIGRGFAHIDPIFGKVDYLVEKIERADCLMNDGKADRKGRFIAGAKHLTETEPMAAVWSLCKGMPSRVMDNFTVFNGPAFSPSGDRIYFADSPTQVIRTATYDAETASFGPIEDFAVLGEGDGYPDGMTVDAEGCLWNAHWDGWRLTRYRPDGSIERVVEMPVQRPTSLCFGGADLTTLYVTSASTRMTAAELQKAPLSGAVFRIDTDIQGLAEAPVSIGENHASAG